MADSKGTRKPVDPELEALPEPRRPWRRATLVTMGVTAALAMGVAWGLLPQAGFALRKGAPKELGSLTHVQLAPDLVNEWAHGEADLDDRSVQYRRPLDADFFRLAKVKGNDGVWVELRIPSGIEPEHYVPPNSFVGRLVPFDRAGLRHASLSEAVNEALGTPVPQHAWLLVDGEAPATTRWTLGLIGLFTAFALFNLWGIARLSLPVKESAHRA